MYMYYVKSLGDTDKTGMRTWYFLRLSGESGPSSTFTGTYGLSSVSIGSHTLAQLLPTAFSVKKN